MRTNTEIDDDLMAKALQAGPFKTKKGALEAGMRLLARKSAYREIVKWRGKLQWEGDDSVDWTSAPADESAWALVAREPAPGKKNRAGR